MATKTLSRILNRSENKNLSSFSEVSEGDDSFTTFHFEDEDNQKTEIDESVLTESDLFKEKHEESFSRRKDIVWEHFEKERKYLGEITGIDYNNHTFSASLVGSDDSVNRAVTFSIDDIPTEDAQYIDVGRRIIFIYGKQYRNGTVTNESKLYFRKDSNWTKREIELKRKEAEELYKMLKESSNEGHND